MIAAHEEGGATMSSISRRYLLGAGLAGSLPPVLLPNFGQAQPTSAWPTRPIRLIVPYAAGGPSDIIARALQAPLQNLLGQSVVVENRAGGGAIIGTEAAARADDGHTFLVADSPHTIIPAVQPRVPYDPANDFRAVTLLGAVTMILMVNPGLQSQTLTEFLAAARARPESATFGSSGVGSLTHLLPEWLAQLSAARFTIVPYRGSGPALLDVVAGQINAIFSSTLAANSQLREGQVRALAVAAAQRLPTLPQVPTFREAGIDMVSGNWWGVLAPRGMPDAVVARLDAAIGQALSDQQIQERFTTLGIEPQPRGPQAFAELLTREFANWDRVARDAGVRAQ
jgi:tripartite-type tricarboxylate transporter receptor subunit TctC